MSVAIRPCPAVTLRGSRRHIGTGCPALSIYPPLSLSRSRRRAARGPGRAKAALIVDVPLVTDAADTVVVRLDPGIGDILLPDTPARRPASPTTLSIAI